MRDLIARQGVECREIMPQRSSVSRLFEINSKDVIGFDLKEKEIQLEISGFRMFVTGNEACGFVRN